MVVRVVDGVLAPVVVVLSASPAGPFAIAADASLSGPVSAPGVVVACALVSIGAVTAILVVVHEPVWTHHARAALLAQHPVFINTDRRRNHVLLRGLPGVEGPRVAGLDDPGGHVEGLLSVRLVDPGQGLRRLRPLEFGGSQSLQHLDPRGHGIGGGLIGGGFEVGGVRILALCGLEGFEFLLFFVGGLQDAHFHQAHPEEISHVRDALALHVEHHHALEDLLGIRVRGHGQHAHERFHGAVAPTAGTGTDLDGHVEGRGTQVVLDDVLARLGVRLGLEQFDGAGLTVGAYLLHFPALVSVEFLGHPEPDLPTTSNGLCHVRHVNKRLHVEALLNQLDRLPGDVADHLLGVLGGSQDLAHVLVGELQERGQGLGDLGGLGVGDGTGGHLLAVGVRDGIHQQVGPVLDVVL